MARPYQPLQPHLQLLLQAHTMVACMSIFMRAVVAITLATQRAGVSMKSKAGARKRKTETKKSRSRRRSRTSIKEIQKQCLLCLCNLQICVGNSLLDLHRLLHGRKKNRRLQTPLSLRSLLPAHATLPHRLNALRRPVLPVHRLRMRPNLPHPLLVRWNRSRLHRT
jgi:hypothetical protein